MEKELRERVNNIREVVMNLLVGITEEEMNSKRFHVNFNGPIDPRSIAILDDYIESESSGMLGGRRFIDTVIVDNNGQPVKNEESVGINHLDCHKYIGSGREVYHDDIEYVFYNPNNIELSGNNIIVLYENYDFNPLGDYDVEVFQLQ